MACGRQYDPDPYYRSLFSAVRGILFLGTPHRGSNYAGAGRLSARLTSLLGSSTELLEFVDPQSQRLSELNDVFLRSYNHCDIFCFFEAQPPRNTLGLPQPLVVEKSSAIIPGRPHSVLNLNHMELNKFHSQDDQNYQKVRDAIIYLARELCDDTGSGIQTNALGGFKG